MPTGISALFPFTPAPGSLPAQGAEGLFIADILNALRISRTNSLAGTEASAPDCGLCHTAINYIAGGTANTYDLVVKTEGLTEALVYGSWQNWLVAALTLSVAICFGMVNFSEIGSAAWISVSKPLHFGLAFDFSACVAIGLLFAINSIQAIGDFTATTVGLSAALGGGISQASAWLN